MKITLYTQSQKDYAPINIRLWDGRKVDAKAMGHSSINVSLTYLRGLEIFALTEEDMPMI